MARAATFSDCEDGSEFPVEIGLNPIRTEEGVLVLSAIVDITERSGGRGWSCARTSGCFAPSLNRQASAWR